MRLSDRLYQYGKSDIYPMHMPGHKRHMKMKYIEGLYQMDITEIDDFDNLHHAQGILKSAQERAAKLYHSEETHFIVNGSTGGILSAIGGVCSRHDYILVARNCHKSVYHGIELNELTPVYMFPGLNKSFGINEGICAEDVEQYLRMMPEIKAVLLTSPTYEGVISDIRKICDIAHRYGVPVIVDEAHGAHMYFSEVFPCGAVAEGADVVINSLHKTLPSMTQTALIHINGTLVNREKIRRMLTIYQTSSPSYIMMASIDDCMSVMENSGSELMSAYTERLIRTRDALVMMKNIRLLGISDLNSMVSCGYDISKLVLSVKHTGISGGKLHRLLLEKYHIQLEMSSADYVIAMTTVGDTDEGLERFVQAMQEIDAQLRPEDISEKVNQTAVFACPKADMVYSISESYEKSRRLAAITKSCGQIAGEYVYLYPPDVPLIVPGERITRELITLLNYCLQSDIEVTGIETLSEGQCLYVIDEGACSVK